ncbi:hypothetical protein PQJ75_00885 [Rhodoplanes sp. TEM]|uniref:Uncharacterized protein n=1 Tax=Rhodoplanes tepidamans TaxID=200616 RepID=A0ABT5J5E2_RHOTP|nr:MULTISPECIES: hypothetical protein [Rhodoplanes]MDC7784808.1 hypothetical protein [Rhodoplanes tepidamans]MDC7982275.1 hypothetical protein [Rhodoplanes sp. TEM]MDQ0356282.1 hypothetical protein [Rhodoplanes tepidamans]
MSANTFGGARANEDLLRIMKRAGWELGNKPEHDRCPDCLAAARKARRERLKVVTPSKEPEMQKIEPAAAPAPEITAAAAPEQPAPSNAPREMTLDDAFVVYEQLAEVYDTSRKSYTGDWTDAKVATHLGVPRAWVVDVRRRRFGDSGMNEGIAALAQDARELVADARAEVDKLTATIGALKATIREAETKHRDLMAKADRIERKIAEIEQAVR